ncbi:uncharacterized protein LOC104896030 [Beta vulgaris subsp. vulgaris]|uniref:uncharacterized protein LOC104896030 n=1 Tax=Beta vulgaris subsp. vulgaris TaxID=3555 RepID=UPI002036D36F|nr:uncharacterized protein LOC104896030 [Beta vulgaris subsp. vulgaris]
MVVLASSVSMSSTTAMMGSTFLYSQQPQKPFFILPKSRNTTHSLSLSSLSIGGIPPSSLRTPAVAVAAAADTTQSSPSSTQDQTTKKYYFVVANAKFMLDEEEHFQEQMFERLRYFGEQNKEQDFWLVIEPKFLEKFPNITKRLKRPAVALVSTNGTWITFMKLRLDRVLAESYEADSIEEALASNPTKLEFEEPEKWVAPYTKYKSGWWESFLPPGSQKPQA